MILTAKWRNGEKLLAHPPVDDILVIYKILVSTIDRSLQEDVVKDLQSIQKDMKMCYIGLIGKQ